MLLPPLPLMQLLILQRDFITFSITSTTSFTITFLINNSNNNGHFHALFHQRAHSPFIHKNSVNIKLRKPVIVPVTSVEITGSEALLAISFTTLLSKCLMKGKGRSALG